jgi:hypothetical protein
MEGRAICEAYLTAITEELQEALPIFYPTSSEKGSKEAVCQRDSFRSYIHRVCLVEIVKGPSL